MASADDPAALYAAHYGTLVAIATTEFEIPEAHAERLANIVLVSILKYLDHLSDPAVWLAFSMRYAAHHYNRVKARGRPHATREDN